MPNTYSNESGGQKHQRHEGNRLHRPAVLLSRGGYLSRLLSDDVV